MSQQATHGRVDLCTCHGRWKESGHAPDCPARQPDDDPHGCTCHGRIPAWKGEGHAPDCPAAAFVRGLGGR